MASLLTFASDFPTQLFRMPEIIFVVGGTIAIVCIFCATISKIVVNRSREQTKREMAAYVAEGSIDADQAVAMLNAGRSKDDEDDCCA